MGKEKRKLNHKNIMVITILVVVIAIFVTVVLFFGNKDTPPDQTAIVDALKQLPNIVDVSVATEYNDPNGQLNKDGGYIADILFSVDVINQNDIAGVTLVEKGTDAGGSIEIYRTRQDAEKRNTYLGTFDGTILTSGSHKVVGTCVIRTAHSLTASLQNILENNIEKMLTGRNDYVSMDTYLIEVAKEIALNENLSRYETAIKLAGYGYPLEKSEAISMICGVDFNKIAELLLENYANYYATIYPNMVALLLEERGFTDENIEFAIERADVDWKLYAKIHARDFVEINGEEYYISPWDVVIYLNNEKGYSVSDSEYGVANCNVDWNQKALEYIDYIEYDGILGPKISYITALTDVGFTSDQAEYAVNNCSNDWNKHSLLCLAHYVEDLCSTTPNYSDCYAKLKDWGFSDSEIDFALDNYDKLIYPDKLDYIVYFDTDGGYLSPMSMRVTFGETYTLPVPAKEGYDFVGWYNGSVEVTDGTWYTASDITLKAKWKFTLYNITYELNDGINHEDNPYVYTLDDEIVLKVPSRTGYTFVGWTYEGQSTPVEEVIISKGSMGDKLFVANWEAKKYTVTFDSNGGSVVEKLIVTYDENVTLPVPTTAKKGYTFGGWYNGNNEFTSGIWKTAYNITLTAKWIPRTDVGYVVNHYQQNITDDGYTLLETQQFKGTAGAVITPERNLYTGFSLPASQTVVIKPDGSLVVDYYYTRNVYSIYFVTNGGDLIDTIVKKYEAEIRVPDATREGYIFGGWFINAALTTGYTKPITMPATSRTLYAYWAEENKPSDFTYSGSSAITVSAYKGTSTTMWVPSYIGGKEVTTIADTAFKNNMLITKVVIPDTVASIGKDILKGCDNIEDLTVPFINKVLGKFFGEALNDRGRSGDGARTSTSDYTHQYTEYSNGGYFSNDRHYWIYCFNIPKTLKYVTVTVQTEIPDNAFRNCDLIKEINILGDVTSIGSRAFENCASLITIFIPETVKIIGANAFKGCTSLTINCEAAYAPEGWDVNWNPSNCPVYWNKKR